MKNINKDFESYFRKYWALIYRTALKILKNPEDAKNVASDTFKSLYEYMLKSEEGIRTPHAWLVVTVMRRSYDFLRVKQPDAARDADTPSEVLCGKSEERMFSGEILNRLYSHNRKWFDVVEKYYILGLPTKEIAREYGCSEHTVNTLLSRAKDFLREEYKGCRNLNPGYVLLFLSLAALPPFFM